MPCMVIAVPKTITCVNNKYDTNTSNFIMRAITLKYTKLFQLNNLSSLPSFYSISI